MTLPLLYRMTRNNGWIVPNRVDLCLYRRWTFACWIILHNRRRCRKILKTVADSMLRFLHDLYRNCNELRRHFQDPPRAISSFDQPVGTAYEMPGHDGPTSCSPPPFHRTYPCCIISHWRWRYNIFQDVSRLRIAWPIIKDWWE